MQEEQTVKLGGLVLALPALACLKALAFEPQHSILDSKCCRARFCS